MGGTMLVRLEAGTAEPRVINLAEVPIWNRWVLRGASD